jgi:hypothetical protein
LENFNIKNVNEKPVSGEGKREMGGENLRSS